jgi:hypothetical protein
MVSEGSGNDTSNTRIKEELDKEEKEKALQETEAK